MAGQIDDLKDILKNGKALIICGAGVSAALTGGRAPGWKTLIEKCVEYGQQKKLLNKHDLEDCNRWLAAGTETEQWLYAAERVRSKIGDGFRLCLADALEKLVCVNSDLLQNLKLLQGFGNSISTTNYDDLLMKGLGARAVTWLHPVDAIKIVKGTSNNIFHIHGHWAESDSVVFSASDYTRVTQPERSQFVQKLAIHRRTLVFLGCSLDGLSDANMGKLLEWFQTSWEGLGERHYVLCLEKDKTEWPDAVTPIVYGTSHVELTAFLSDLAPQPIAAVERLEVDPNLIGRGDIKQRILEWVQAGNAPVIISGGPGMGKSAMALAVAYDPAMRAKFGDERYFLRLDAAGDAHAMISAAAAKLGVRVQPATAEMIADQMAGAIARPTLLILDNLESPWDKNRAEVENVIARLAACSQLQLLLTIRGATPNLSCAAHRMDDIEQLDAADSLVLFHRATGDLFIGDSDLSKLMAVLAGHPLCITLMAAQADGSTVKDVLARWEKQRAAMVWKDGADHRMNNLNISVGLSFERLSRFGKRLARLVARLPAGFALAMARDILGDAAVEATRELKQARLVEMRDDRLSMLAPLREAILLQKVQKRADEGKLLRGMMAIAAKGKKVLQNMTPEEIAEIENLDAALLWAVDDGVTEGLIEAQIGVATFHRITTRGGANSVMRGVAFWRDRFGRQEEAICIFNLGHIALDRSDHEGSRVKFEEALPLYRKVGDVLGEANCIMILGHIALARSDHEGSRAKFEEALPLYRKVGDVVGEANCIQSLGDIALRRSDHEGARVKFEEALLLYRKAGNVLGEANCIRGLGDIVEREQDAKAAAPLWRDALALYGRIPEPYSMGATHRRLARATEGKDKAHHLAEARRLWLSIGRVDLVAEFLDSG